MLSIIKRLSLLILLWCGLDAHGQINCVTTQYSSNDGLPDNRVLCSIKDREGFMWFGTWMGLCRFDGHDFLTYRSRPGDNSNLKNNRINVILEDKEGFLWVGADDSRIYRFDKRKEEFIALTALSTVPGLSGAHVSEIASFDRGSIWLRSTAGLYLVTILGEGRIKVKQYHTFAEAPFKIPSNNIVFLALIDPLTVIAATDKGSVIIEKKNGTYAVNSELTGELRGLDVTSWSATDKDIYLSTSGGRILILNKATKQVRKFRITKQRINTICASKKTGKLYCTTSDRRLIVLTQHQNSFTSHAVRTKVPILSAFEDSSGLLWLEPEEEGVFKYDPSTNKIKFFLSESSGYVGRQKVAMDYQVIEDNRGNVWVNSKGFGFGYYDVKRDVIQRFYDDFSGVHEFQQLSVILMNDPDGIIWLIPGSGGVEKCVLSLTPFKHTSTPVSKASDPSAVRGMMVDKKGRLWLGSREGYLNVLKDGQPIRELFESEIPKNVYCILEDRKGNIWLGTKGYGLYKAEPTDTGRTRYRIKRYSVDSRNTLAIPSNIIYTLLEDSKGRIWAGSFEKGLILVEQIQGKVSFRTIDNFFHNYPRANALRVRHLAEDRLGNLWIGTTGGLVIFNANTSDLKKVDFTIYRKQPYDVKSLGDNDVQFVYRDRSHQMWVLTSAGGFNQALGSNPLRKVIFSNYSTNNGLANDCVLSCLEDNDGNLWLGLQNRICRFSPQSDQIKNFDMNEGFSGGGISEASCAKLPDGSLLFGTTRGYLSFDPSQVTSKKITGTIAITDLHINNERFDPGEGSKGNANVNYLDTLVLAYNQNNISLFYTTLNYRTEDRAQYEFRLLGYDKEWQNNRGLRRTTYTNLDPGKYIFEVRARDIDMYENLPLKRLTVIISPPYWKTWWAYFIYFTLLFCVVLAIKKNAVTMLRLRRDVAVEKKMTELKLSFFTQASHEIRTPLSLVISPLEEVLKNEHLSDKGNEYVRLVLRNAQRMLLFFNQLLDLRKAQSGMAELKATSVELIAFLRKEAEYFIEAARQRNISINLLSEVKEVTVYLDEEKMDIVVYNILSNAVKFSPDNSVISIIVERPMSQQHILIKIKDEGRGVNEDELKDIFSLYYEGVTDKKHAHKGTGIGLSLAKELVKLHKGEIFAENSPTGGLIVNIMLPFGSL